MCAIFGSSDKEKFLELAELNQYRGKYSNSTSAFVVNRFKSFGDSSAEHLFTQRQLGLFDDHWVKEHNEVNTTGYITYYLGHVQAPTTDSVKTHPSNINADLLWHNGIVKDYQVKSWQHEYGHVDWDTELLHRHLLFGNDLDNVDGTFSCARYEDRYSALTLFRNEISPLYYDEDLNISSSKFDNSKETESGVLYLMDLQKSELEPMKRFETKENPYYFG